jgi:hypothetical protein
MTVEAANIILVPLKQALLAGGVTPVDIDFGALEEHFTNAARQYDADRQAFLGTYIENPDLPLLSKKWQRSAKSLTGWAETWFASYYENSEEQETALNILDRITKESGIRRKNLRTHVRFMKEALKDDPQYLKKIDKLEDEEFGADSFLRSAIKTQQHFIDIYKSGETYVPVEIKEETEAGEYISKIYHKYPAGTMYRRGLIFPMAPIPLNEPVPQMPEVYARYKSLPPEVLEYDPKVDELMPVKGYISEDGLVDDKSVIWHPETHTVDMGFRGGERVTWKFWKPKDTRDVLDPNSWCAQYRCRAYREYLESKQFRILKPGPFEKEPEPYDRKPGGGNR